jgi:hypothetical protein
MQKLVIAAGLMLILIGVLWPYVGRLPGDIVIERESVRFYFPIVTCLIASIVFSVVLWLINR